MKNSQKKIMLIITVLLIAIIPMNVFATSSDSLGANENAITVAAIASPGITSLIAYPGNEAGTYYSGLKVSRTQAANMYLNLYAPQNIKDFLPTLDPAIYTGWRCTTNFIVPNNATSVAYYLNGTYVGASSVIGGGSYSYKYFSPKASGFSVLKVVATTTTGSVILGYSRLYFY